ncbi:MAG: GMC oxidoreductase [Steroidobacter sp.]
MIIDAKDLQEDSVIEGDVVIAGGGMAGITLARQLGDAGLDIVILESGGAAPDQRMQALYKGKMTLGGPGNSTRNLDEYLGSSRVRCFGGSGMRWGGKCAPLDAIDFEKRDWIPHSGWPIDREQMQPFYDRACRTLSLQAFGSAPESVLGRKDPLFGERSAAFTLRPRRYSLTTGAIGDGYSDFIRSAADHPRVRVYLNANLRRMRLKDDGRSVHSLEVMELNGRKHTARGRAYVLAMGGIENVRLMLVSDDVHRTGVGNHSDWLGRAFQGHTVISHENTTSLSLHRPDSELAMFNNANLDQPHAVLGVTDAAQRKSKSVNFTATLTSEPTDVPASSIAIQSLAERLAAAGPTARRGVYFMIEHTPNRDSRLTLSPEEVDELGMPRIRLDMRYNPLELETFERSVSMLAAELGRLDIGRVRWSRRREELIQLMGGPSRHHMGATRMAASSTDGVVDEHCRVHGVGNLYVAGSSVFPTSGIANPTLTLLALAHRLGDHVASGMRA